MRLLFGRTSERRATGEKRRTREEEPGTFRRWVVGMKGLVPCDCKLYETNNPVEIGDTIESKLDPG